MFKVYDSETDEILGESASILDASTIALSEHKRGREDIGVIETTNNLRWEYLPGRGLVSCNF